MIFWLLATVALSVILVILAMDYKDIKKENKLLKQLKVRDLWLIKERIKMMDHRDFEFCISTLYSMLGYKTETTRATKDGGKDIVIQDENGEFIFVECKHWKDCVRDDIDEENEYSRSAIGQDVCQKLRGAMDYGFDGITPIKKGIVVTTTRFTEQAKTYCKAMNIEMVDIDGIMRMVEHIGSEKIYSVVGIKRDGYLFE